ncbi:hypothetical protein HDF11_003015 [Tunturiibacter psychrotolerans]
MRAQRYTPTPWYRCGEILLVPAQSGLGMTAKVGLALITLLNAASRRGIKPKRCLQLGVALSGTCARPNMLYTGFGPNSGTPNRSKVEESTLNGNTGTS